MEWDKAVFLVNCFGYLEVSLAFHCSYLVTTKLGLIALMWPTFVVLQKHVLESFSFTTARVATLHTMLDRYVKYISNTHVRPPPRPPLPLLDRTGID